MLSSDTVRELRPCGCGSTLPLGAAHLPFNECFDFFKNETHLTGAVTNACELCCAGAAVKYGFSRAANYLGHSLGVDTCLVIN